MIEQKSFTLKQVSKMLGVSTKTLQRWDNAGKIKTFRTFGNHRRIYESEIRRLQKKPQPQNCAIYARVSSRKQTQDGNIERQKERLVEYAKNKGYCLTHVFCETASGINENRKQLEKLLCLVIEHQVDIVLIEFKDRLARFGYSYLVKLIESHGAQVEIVTKEEAPKNATQELVEDMLAIVTCFSAKLYGQRSQKFKKKIEQVIKEELPDGKSDKDNQNKDSKPQ
jgi:excisionase family DNA binding protein